MLGAKKVQGRSVLPVRKDLNFLKQRRRSPFWGSLLGQVRLGEHRDEPLEHLGVERPPALLDAGQGLERGQRLAAARGVAGQVVVLVAQGERLNVGGQQPAHGPGRVPGAVLALVVEQDALQRLLGQGQGRAQPHAQGWVGPDQVLLLLAQVVGPACEDVRGQLQLADVVEHGPYAYRDHEVRVLLDVGGEQADGQDHDRDAVPEQLVALGDEPGQLLERVLAGEKLERVGYERADLAEAALVDVAGQVLVERLLGQGHGRVVPCPCAVAHRDHLVVQELLDVVLHVLGVELVVLGFDVEVVHAELPEALLVGVGEEFALLGIEHQVVVLLEVQGKTAHPGWDDHVGRDLEQAALPGGLLGPAGPVAVVGVFGVAHDFLLGTPGPA